MKDLIKGHILSGEFDTAYRLMSEVDFLEFEEHFISAAHEEESTMFYTFILDCIKKEETSELHDLAFLLHVYPYSEHDGVFHSAYYHAERSMILTDHKEVKSLLQMLLLHAIPEPLLSDKQAFDISKQILKIDPENKVARNIMKETAKRMDQVVVDFSQLSKSQNA